MLHFLHRLIGLHAPLSLPLLLALTLVSPQTWTHAASAPLRAAGATAASVPLDDPIEVKVNFMSELLNNDSGDTLEAPTGYLKDFGQAYGTRQTPEGYDYGWKRVSDGQPFDVSQHALDNSNGSGRNRLGSAYTSASDQAKLEGTLVHTQGNYLSSWAAQPRGQEVYWEVAVPNGTYEVTIGAGEYTAGVDPEIHTFNAEGITAISTFVPTGANASSTRVTNGTVTVDVTDGALTITALGGINSKINYVEITQTATPAPTPGVFTFTPAGLELSLTTGTTGTATADLAVSEGTPTIGMVADPAATWLTLPAAPALGQNTFAVDATNLAKNTQHSTPVVVSAVGFYPAVLPVNLDVTPLPPVAVPFRINAAGPERTIGGDVFAADQFFIHRSTETTNTSTGSYGAIDGVPSGDEALYYDRRYGVDMGYAVPVADGQYTVLVHMVENFQTAANARVFDISIEGTQVEDDLDLFAAGGNRQKVLIKRSYDVTVADQELNIDFLASINNAIVNAIEILPFTPANTAPVVLNPIPDQTATEGVAFSFAVPVTTFDDAEDDALTLTATLAGGDALPAWLSFATSTFSGTPEAGDVGMLAIVVTATDGSEAVSDTFDLTVEAAPVVNQPPTVANALQDQTATEGIAFSFTVPVNTFSDANGDTLMLTAALEGGATLPSWLSFAGAVFEGTPMAADLGTLSLVVTASDGSEAISDTFNLTIEAAPVIGCDPISSLPCEDIAVSLPFSLDFDGTEGGLADKNDVGTGFTMVDAYSGTRLAVDGSVSVSEVPGYEPSRLTVNAGTLTIATNKGIGFLTNNNQLNTLGVGFSGSAPFVVETTLLQPFNGTSSQQGGIWVGKNDNTFLKLVVTGNKVEMRQEVNDGSSTVNDTTNPDQRITETITNLNQQTVRLRLVVDPLAHTATGFYSTDGVTYTNVGTAYGTPALDISAMNLTDGNLYAGLFATHRNASTSVNYTFEAFAIAHPLTNTAPVVLNPIPDQTATEGVAFSFAVPVTTFDDAEDDALTLTATLAGGDALPAWLSFATSTFSGTPEAGDVGMLAIVVTATDGSEAVSDTFDLTVEAAPVVNQPPTVANALQDQTATEGIAFSFTVPANTFSDANGDTLTLTAALEGGATLPSWLSFAGAVFEGTPMAADLGSLSLVVTASDGSEAISDTFNLTIEAAPVVDACTPLSVLPCDELVVELPVNLSFSGAEGGLLDKNGAATGFTMAVPHSESRLPADGAATYPDVNGYEPSKLLIENGTLIVTATKGIAYLDPPASNENNNQINSLGVGLQNLTQTFSLKTQLNGLVTGGDAAQAGLWFGIDEDNFIKLNANNDNQIELRREVGGVSANTDQVQIQGLSLANATIVLRLEINPQARIATAYYTINGGSETLLSVGGISTLSLPASYFTGTSVSAEVGAASFAGVYATYRKGSVFNATFDYFTLEEFTPPNVAPVVANGLADQTAMEGAAFSFAVPANTFSDANGDTLTLTATVNGGDALPTWLEFDGSTFSGTPSAGDVGTLNIVVTATDGSETVSDNFVLTIEAAPVPCSPISLLPCDELAVTLPFALDFTGNEGGLAETGFTMVDVPSARLAADGTPTYPDVPGYEPGRLSFTNGTLQILSNKGIQYSQPSGTPSSSETNSQLNALGVGYDGQTPVILRTTLVGINFVPSNGNTNSQQAGLWMGLDEDNYAKLVIYRNGANVGSPELLIETNVSGTLNFGTNNDSIFDIKPSVSIPNLSTHTVTLTMVLDPATQKITASYQVDSDPEVTLGTLSAPATFFTGTDHDNDPATTPMTYAGIFATHRRATSAFTATFEDFSLEPVVATQAQLIFTPSDLSVSVPSGSATSFAVHLNTSDEFEREVTFTATEGTSGPAPQWLTYQEKTLTAEHEVTHHTSLPEPSFDVDAAALTPGTYTAVITASAEGYEPAQLTVEVVVSTIEEGLRPYVTAVRPADNATNVPLAQSISVDLQFPSGKSLDGSTVNTSTVKLFRISGNDTTEVAGTTVNDTGGNDAITLSAPLALGTTYLFTISDAVRDQNGYALLPFHSKFTTVVSEDDVPTDLAGVSFTEQILIDNNFGSDGFTSLVIGPDHRLYAATSGGKIERWDINANGTIDNHVTISPFGGSRRLLIGFHFDQSATESNLVAWISHSAPAFSGVADFTGKISRIDLNNPAAPQVTDYVINLPRSYKDHSTNSIDFGPDGALYFMQGSNTAMGAPDGAWGNRSEHMLTAAVLRLDLNKLPANLPLDAKTTDAGGAYDPYAANAPLTIFGSGVRNAYDLVWHSNGQLYVPTNGSAAGGNTPALPSGTVWSDGTTYSGPNISALNDVRDTQNDYLFRVVQGGYYGHPNVLRHEYILNGGNPTAGEDPGEVVWSNGGYPVGTPVEPNYRGYAYDFGLNKSPNGVIEYRSNAFGGTLRGKLLVCRFSGGDDLIVLEPGVANLDIIKATEGSQVPGLRRPFSNPLDVVEDLTNGNLYISEYFDGNGDGQPRITLLKADVPAVDAPQIALDADRLIFDQVTSQGASATVNLVVSNAGSADLEISQIDLTGALSNQFQLTNAPVAFPVVLAPNATLTLGVSFDPTSNGPKVASLQILSNSLEQSTATVALQGLGKQGTGGSNEPSLQWILDTYGIAINVGDDNPSTNIIHSSTTSQKAALLGDEVSMPRFEKAGTGPVTVELLSVFGPTDNNPVVGFGWYESGSAAATHELFTVSNNPVANGQTLNAPVTGNLQFDPGAQSFGFYSRWPYFSNRHLYSEDALNTFSGAIPHHVRVYPLPGEANAYVIATEEHTSGFDYQDIVVIARNVKKYEEGPVVADVIQINFSDEATTPPNGYLKDFGSAYGDRGNGYSYGWISTTNGSPVSLVGQGRNRTTSGQSNPLLATSIHMNHPTTPPSGYWEIAVPNGSYTVTVTAGDANAGNDPEVHRVNAEGINLINNFVPSGSSSAATRHTTGSGIVQVLDGKLTLDYAGGGVNTKLNAVVIEPYDVPVASTLRLNVGGPEFTDAQARVWDADQYFTGGVISSKTFDVPGTTDDALYLTYRYAEGANGASAGAPFSYNIPVTSTDPVTVKLHFLEPYYGAPGGGAGAVGARLFHVDIEGSRVLSNFDLYAQEGAGKAIVRTFENIAVTGGILNIDFTSVTNNAIISAIEVIEGEGGTTPPPATAQFKVNFSDAATVAPNGWLKDYGQAFGNRGNGYSYGWLTTTGQNGLDLTKNGRNRARPAIDLLLNTLVHMQYGTSIDPNPNSGTFEEGIWEVAVANGAYNVTVSVGDQGSGQNGYDSQHTLNVEGVTAIDQFQGSAAQEYLENTVTVVVTDGRLTITAFGGVNTKINAIEVVPTEGSDRPYVISSIPSNGATNVDIRDLTISANNLYFPEGTDLDGATATNQNVKLFRLTANNQVVEEVAGDVNDTGGGDALSFIPSQPLLTNTKYKFVITEGVKLTNGAAFLPYEAIFTTGSEEVVPPVDLAGVSFTRSTNFGGNELLDRFTSLVVGPDGKLYGSTLGGSIKRWDMQPDGSLINYEELQPALTGSRLDFSGPEARAIIGLAFDPNATAENLVAYITHCKLINFEVNSADSLNWDGKITRLSGPNLSQTQDLVIHLPRSRKDHLTNSIAFKPGEDRVIYFNQGSNSAGGELDGTWKKRERMLAGAVLRLDLDKLPANLPLDVRTTENFAVLNTAPSTGLTLSDGTYNPYSQDAPLTIFGSGVRNAYDLVWHSNGQLYVPANGTAGGSNTPGSANYVNRDPSGLGVRRPDGTFYNHTAFPAIPATNNNAVQKDWLFRVEQGGYYGHPNPYRGEFVLNHGGASYNDVPGQAGTHVDVPNYPGSIVPDPNYRRPAFDFGFNKSPNGVIEYKSNAFGGKLKGMLVVCRFSNGSDLILLQPGGASKDIANSYLNVTGLTGLDDPLEVVEDPKTGNLYVSEYDRSNNGVARLTLLKANVQATPQPELVVTPSELIFEAVKGVTTAQQQVTVKNAGTADLNITGVTLSGSFANQFDQVSGPATATLEPDEETTYAFTFSPDNNGNNLGDMSATFSITSNDTTGGSTKSVGLYGLKKNGFEGGNEPALQAVVNTLGYGINVGWTGLTPPSDPTGTTPKGQEVQVPLFVKAGTGPVGILPVARYSPAEELPFGWYQNQGGNVTHHRVGVLENGLPSAQTLFPGLASGNQQFEPQGAIFGIYVESNSFGRFNYTEDALNTGGVPHRTRIYPMRDRAGQPIANSFLVCFEDASNGDYQDYVFVVSNAKPYEAGSLLLTFAPDALNFQLNPNTVSAPKSATLTTNGAVTSSGVTLSASKNWVVLPNPVTLGSPMPFAVDASSLGVGQHTATVTASAPGYVSTTIQITATVTDEVVWAYQFNFQDGSVTSPAGYVDDIGRPYGLQSNGMTFGWVLPGTTTPADASANTRNRQVNGVSSLLNTLNIINHATSADLYPPRDWAISLPNGKYYVNVSVGDAGSDNDSQHKVDANGVTVVTYDEETNGPLGMHHGEGTAMVDVVNGRMQLTQGLGGRMTKVNYVRIAPVDVTKQPPTILATFDGLSSDVDEYRGAVTVTLEATDNSGSGMASLTYSLNGTDYTTYTEPLVFDETSAYTLTVRAEDNNGNVTSRTYSFTVMEASGALAAIENMTKIPGTDRGFPADDFYTFHRLGDPQQARVHDQNVMRIHNEGTSDLIITAIALPDATKFTYTILPDDDQSVELPLVIAPNSSRDLQLTFIGTTGNNNNAVFTQQISFTSNADNAATLTATLRGAYSPFPEGGREITAQQVFNSFGFQTSMLSYVNDNYEVVSNPTTNPSSNYPKAELVDGGYEGDMILSKTFVQADPTKPVIGIQLSALHGGPGSDYGRFIAVNNENIVAGMNFSHNQYYYQTLLPQNNSGVINNDRATSITQPFRISVAGYNTGGHQDTLLGVRVFKVIDRDGNVIPNEYIVLQDFVQNGCGAGSANCDWNDNTFYFINIRPEALPQVTQIQDTMVVAQRAFNYNVARYFDRGYPGNQLTYTVSSLPAWMQFNAQTVTFSGTPTANATATEVTLTATDLNGLVVSSTFTIGVDTPPTLASLGNRQDPVGTELTAVAIVEADDEDDLTYAATGLPTGVVMDETTGLVTGTLTQRGTYAVTVTVDDGSFAPVSVNLTWDVQNAAPVADAGIDQQVQTSTGSADVTLDGSRSQDPYGAITSYVWRENGNQLATGVTPTLTLSVGTHQLVLTVEDADGAVDTDGVTITVTPFTPNAGPLASAGADQSVVDADNNGVETVSLNGSGSSDSDGEIVSYVWSENGNPLATGATPSVSLAVGVHQITLTVTDDDNATATDQVQVTVTSPTVEEGFTLRLNAGGPTVSYQSETFTADQGSGYYNSEHTYSNPGLSVPSLYQTERGSTADQGTLSYAIPVPNGRYTVRTHHAELYFGQSGPAAQAGQRVFSISLEGAVVDPSLDLQVVSGGAPVVRTFTDVEVSDGVLNLVLSATANRPTLAGLEVIATPVSPLSTYRINAGGPTQTVNGVTWTGCQTGNCQGWVAGGFVHTDFGSAISGVQSPLNQNLFQTEWTGGQTNGVGVGQVAFGYHLPVTNGRYQVRLYFAELNKGGVGQRVFDVNLEGGAPELVSFDIVQAAGSQNVALMRQFELEVSDGVLDIDFIRRVENAKVSAIEVVPAPGVARQDYWLEAECAQVGSNWQVHADASASQGQYVEVQPGLNSGDAAPAAVAANRVRFSVTVSQAGSYRLYARLRAASGTDDSFWVRINGGSWIKWWQGLQTGNSFAWKQVSQGPFSLSAGVNTIDVAYREDGAQLDKLYLTASENLPAGLGQDASNCTVAPNQPPVAAAGADQTVIDTDNNGTQAVQLNGTNSTDLDGTLQSYVWSENGNPLATGATPTVTLAVGVHQITLTVTDNRGATATDQVQITVNKPVYNLTVGVSGNGSVSPQSGSYEAGSVVTLTATPANGYLFDGWSGAATGTTNPLTLVMDGNKTLQATFVAEPSAGFTLRLNAGGPTVSYQSETFTADQGSGYYNSEHTYSNPGLSVPSLYQTERGSTADQGTLSYAIPVPNGRYTVRTHHAELYFGQSGPAAQAGQRVFSISLEGAVVDPSLDLQVVSGGAPVVRTFTDVEVSDGVLNLVLSATANRPTLAGLEVIATPVSPLSTYRINAGGPTQTVNGVTWTGCQTGNCQGWVAGGFVHTDFGSAISGVQSPLNQNLFQTEWTGGQTNGVGVGQVAFGYHLPVTNGRYQVRLYFAELNKGGVGQRVFDVNLEGGAPELVSFDIVQAAGSQNVALMRQFELEVSDGVLDIDFIRRVENAKVSAIEVVPAPGVARQDYWLEAECAQVGSNWQVHADASASQGQYVEVQPGLNSGDAAPAAVAANRVRFSVTVSQAGSYRLYARLRAASGTDDSFWVRINGGSWIKWWQGLQTGNSFAWKQVSQGPFSLSAGVNTIDVAYREDGAQLDKLYLTASENLPAGLGQDASNCNSALARSGPSAATATADGTPVSLMIYPNPSRGLFRVTFDGEQPEHGKISIITTTGVILKEMTVERGEWEIDLGTQAAGVYLMRLEFGDQIRHERIQKL
ncbi:malectin domain-containing carbohydrate-binding protein [Catalinimonas alkaloidigena]|uniref:malectin domain-containing carbohydrate-binding protein n=1 Tax=Catalinimonas alkaloidigena TaxID=1075417 RepID=UPI0015A1C503|nr:malectin domain-containing carbohydrate-binding protein [Catalinimonas alkaloidigena]